MAQSDDDRRIAPRLPALLRVDYPDLSRFVVDYSENVSKNGLFIATAETHTVGEVITFQISFPGLMAPMMLKGRVRWLRLEANEEGQPGIGVELLFEGDNTHRQRISALAETAAAAAGAQRSTTHDRTFRILLAEDNPEVREMVRFGIAKVASTDTSGGVRVEIVESGDGADAWNKLNAQTFNLLIADTEMPVLDGHALIRQVRSHEGLRSLAIVAVSTEAESRSQALASGADFFLPKPIKLSDIVVTVRTLLRLAG